MEGRQLGFRTPRWGRAIFYAVPVTLFLVWIVVLMGLMTLNSCTRVTVSLRSPKDGETNLPVNTSIEWTLDSKKNFYFEVFLGTSTDVTLVATTTQNTYTLEGLEPETTYFWKVVAVDHRGKRFESQVWSFRTTTRPDEPGSPQPPNGATDVATPLVLGWSCSDPDGDKLTYDIYIGPDGSMQLVESNWEKNEYTPAVEIKLDTEYFWQVIAKDEKGAVREGPVWRFRTPVPPPVEPELTPESTPATSTESPENISYDGVEPELNEPVQDATGSGAGGN